ncbi:hypothetical protein HK105_201377 [Polyrhizophydium stewartii]|uniref:Uncharacterized protein n=1 Tax=Polyrhizophydium stewartii TaxID=2732419 RepID=A0ABR4NHW4_9FUNG|nr:hypothetical protein HK105_007752 [Polyrhizophydium stewartii]
MGDTGAETARRAEPATKSKPPKPGSKKAQLLKKQSDAAGASPAPGAAAAQAGPAEPPAAAVHGAVVVLVFRDARTLKAALDRPHVAYEGGTLKGPLKGVNFPLSALADWDKRTPDKTPAEQDLLALVARLASSPAASASGDDAAPPAAEPLQYLIAGLRGDRSTFVHEWAHARFFLDASFRAAATAIWDELDADLKRAIERELAMRNYRPDVFIDEFQAYICETPDDFGRRWGPRLREHHVRIRALVSAPPNLC